MIMVIIIIMEVMARMIMVNDKENISRGNDAHSHLFIFHPTKRTTSRKPEEGQEGRMEGYKKKVQHDDDDDDDDECNKEERIL